MRIAHIVRALSKLTHDVRGEPLQPLEQMERRDMPALNTAGSASASASASNTSSASQASSTSSSATSASSSASSNTSSGAMPTMTSTSSTGMPEVAKSTSSSTSYTYQVSIPTNETNPFISKETLPSNTVFIAVAGVLGLLAFGVLLTWLIVWLNSRKRAMTEKEVQYYNPFHHETGSNSSALHLLGSSSHSSFIEKSSGSVNSKFSDPVSNLDTTTPGRSYREMSNTMGRRSSMTVSPVLEMMRSSMSNLELPLFNPGPENPSGNSHTPEPSQGPVKKSRPPSQVLEDMLSAIEFSTNYPESRSESS